jgi:glycosyltransferase involved in cell wall biosynthesis
MIQNRPDAFEVFGGDSVQMIKTAEFLRKLGVQVDISLELAPRLDDYEIVHLMNITRVRFTLAQLINAKKQKKKVVLSPIYWKTSEVVSAYWRSFLSLNDFSSLKELWNACLSSLVNKSLLGQIEELTQNRTLATAVLSKADRLLPNSRVEMEILTHDFAEVFRNQKKEFSVIPNGVDAEIFWNASPEAFTRKYGLTDFVLNVGRFSYRKNQLSLIKAMKDTGIDVIFIGDSSRGSSNYYGIKDAIDKLYYLKCKRNADASFKFLGTMSHNALASAYAACRVFALPSLYETPGLSALEAALSGANICVTDGGSTREYFSEFVLYCDPYSIASIRNAILKSYATPKNNRLKEYVLKNFTWDSVAKATLAAYEKTLKR